MVGGLICPLTQGSFFSGFEDFTDPFLLPGKNLHYGIVRQLTLRGLFFVNRRRRR
jgi:hypothetical protein